jgi:3-phosphoshikimate 1-carboxyvinyltransferase
MQLTIHSVKKIMGNICIPGDKSISHRALILGALANGNTRILNLSPGKDVYSTIECLSQMGVRIQKAGPLTVIQGNGLNSLKKPAHHLNAGNSGTTMRLLSGILAAQPFSSTLTGDQSLCKRPMRRIIEPLRHMGAEIVTEDNYIAPLSFYGRALTPIHYDSPIASAQVKSCVLLAGLFSSGQTSFTEPALSRDHTELMLSSFGVPIQRRNGQIGIRGPTALKSCLIDVPGDISSSAFLLIASALLPDSQLTLKNIGINPTRAGILTTIRAMGAQVQTNNECVINGEPRADLSISGSTLYGVTLEGNIIPRLIDEIPILAVAATQANGDTIIRDAGELRYKETDRIQAVSENLKAMGAQINIREDGFIIKGPQKLHGTKIHCHGDHRIAMSFAVAGLVAEGETVIEDWECADISFPGFFQLLRDISYA